MFKHLISATFGALAGFAAAVAPSQAADDIEAKAQTCAVCHGQNGVPLDPKTMPIIWGQQASYMMKQLRDYRNGERNNPIMSPIAKGLAEDDLRKLAAYFAAKSWPAQPTPAVAASPPNGIDAQLRHRWQDEQRRHAEVHARADRQRTGRHGALSIGAVSRATSPAPP